MLIQGLPHLNSEQERELFREYIAAKNKITRSRIEERIVLHNMGLVKKIAKTFSAPGYDLEDLVSIGTVALVAAIRGFDPDRGHKLSTYAGRSIARMILRECRRYRIGCGINSSPALPDEEHKLLSNVETVGRFGLAIEGVAVGEPDNHKGFLFYDAFSNLDLPTRGLLALVISGRTLDDTAKEMRMNRKALGDTVKKLGSRKDIQNLITA